MTTRSKHAHTCYKDEGISTLSVGISLKELRHQMLKCLRGIVWKHCQKSHQEDETH